MWRVSALNWNGHSTKNTKRFGYIWNENDPICMNCMKKKTTKLHTFPQYHKVIYHPNLILQSLNTCKTFSINSSQFDSLNVKNSAAIHIQI